jgi:hypothetical protein
MRIMNLKESGISCRGLFHGAISVLPYRDSGNLESMSISVADCRTDNCSRNLSSTKQECYALNHEVWYDCSVSSVMEWEPVFDPYCVGYFRWSKYCMRV